MSDDVKSFTCANLLVGDDWQVSCSTYPASTPILSINAGSTNLLLSIAGRTVTQPTIDFARALVREVQAFAAEVERFHAEHATPDTTTTPDLAA